MARKALLIAVARATGLFCAAVTFVLTVRPDVDVRLDSGDLRYSYFGVTVETLHRQPAVRQLVLRATETVPDASGQWVRVSPAPGAGKRGLEPATVVLYQGVAAWMEACPPFGRLVVADLQSGCDERKLQSSYLLSFLVEHQMQGSLPCRVVARVSGRARLSQGSGAPGHPE